MVGREPPLRSFSASRTCNIWINFATSPVQPVRVRRSPRRQARATPKRLGADREQGTPPTCSASPSLGAPGSVEVELQRTTGKTFIGEAALQSVGLQGG